MLEGHFCGKLHYNAVFGGGKDKNIERRDAELKTRRQKEKYEERLTCGERELHTAHLTFNPAMWFFR
jgi:hypothetical protein